MADFLVCGYKKLQKILISTEILNIIKAIKFLFTDIKYLKVNTSHC